MGWKSKAVLPLHGCTVFTGSERSFGQRSCSAPERGELHIISVGRKKQISNINIVA